MPVPVNVEMAKLSHFRVDPLTGRNVLVAPARGLRPSKKIPSYAYPLDLPVYAESCSFCPDHEDKTPAELARISLDGPTHWDARCFANLFPSLQLEARNGNERKKHPLPLQSYIHSGEGAHEVIVESCGHNASLSRLSREEIAAVLSILVWRYHALKSIPKMNYFFGFKNYGDFAAASQTHPHWQLEARAFAPWILYLKTKKFAEFAEEHGLCPLCLLLEERIVAETANFRTCVPLAPFENYEVMIAPRKHVSNFAHQLGQRELALEFAGLLQETMARLKRAIQQPALGQEWARYSDPPYNLWLDTAPYDQEAGTFHWHMVVRPITSEDGGHEKGTGEKIITALPEEVAEILKRVVI